MWQRESSGGVPSEKAGVEVVSGRAQVQTAEMEEVIRSMEERELKCVRVHGLRHIDQSVPSRGREFKYLGCSFQAGIGGAIMRTSVQMFPHVLSCIHSLHYWSVSLSRHFEWEGFSRDVRPPRGGREL